MEQRKRSCKEVNLAGWIIQDWGAQLTPELTLRIAYIASWANQVGRLDANYILIGSALEGWRVDISKRKLNRRIDIVEW